MDKLINVVAVGVTYLVNYLVDVVVGKQVTGVDIGTQDALVVLLTGLSLLLIA
jgi:hypothetical protein